MHVELSAEELVIILAGFKTIGVQGTDAMRKVVALEDRLVAESQPDESKPKE